MAMRTHLISLFILNGFFFFSMHAQVAGILGELKEEEQSTIKAIALYPEKERAAILVIAEHPEILVRMDHIRTGTEAKFKSLLNGLPEEDQKKIYNVSRYPELISSMTDRSERRSNDEMHDLLVAYPDDIHSDAYFANRKYFDLLKDMHSLQQSAETALHEILSSYPVQVRDACHQLMELPAVVSVMTENMSTTVLLGDLYRQDPDQLNKELDSLNIVLAEEQAAELDEWKQQLENDPAAMAEYETAAKEFAGEEEYDDDVYDGPIPARYREDFYVHHVWRPYPYWFGWPSWYSYECWYPYPWWYHWGYYYGPQNVIVIIGLPSNFFIDWHFRHHQHLYHYPHFTDQVIRHYYGPRKFGERVQPVLRRWEEEHRRELPANWWNDDKNRVDRIREFGKFKVEYDELVKVAREKSPTEREYLRTNADRYPTLKPVLKEQPEPTKSQPSKIRANDPLREKPQGERVIEKEKSPPSGEIDRAKENHENTWDRMRNEPKQQEPSPTTQPTKKGQTKPPRTEPAKREPPKSAPRQAPPRKKGE